MTVKLAERIDRESCIRWVTRKGDVRSEPTGRLLTVRKVLSEPEPDQSWMDSPIPRAKFVAWMGPL